MSKRRKKLVVEQWVDITDRWINIMTHLQPKAKEMIDSMSETQYSLMCLEIMHCTLFKQYGRQVYLFDKDFSKSIINEKWADLLPDVISHAPFRSFYMKMPYDELSEGILINVVPPGDVVFGHKSLGLQADAGQIELYQKAVLGGKGVYSGSDDDPMDKLFVNDGESVWSIAAFAIPSAIQLMYDDTELGVYPNSLIINGLSYLCSKNADINKVYEPAKLPPNKKSGKRNNRYSQATWHEVGYRIGADLRAYERQKAATHQHTDGGTVRPHMRRAHWHHFWTGPRDGERQLVLKWIAPVVVGAHNGDIVSATGHRVR